MCHNIKPVLPCGKGKVFPSFSVFLQFKLVLIRQHTLHPLFAGPVLTQVFQIAVSYYHSCFVQYNHTELLFLLVRKQTLIHLPQINIYHRHPVKITVVHSCFRHGYCKKRNHFLIGTTAFYIPYECLVSSIFFRHFFYKDTIQILRIRNTGAYIQCHLPLIIDKAGRLEIGIAVKHAQCFIDKRYMVYKLRISLQTQADAVGRRIPFRNHIFGIGNTTAENSIRISHGSTG